MQFIKVETRDHVTTITLDRPEVMNAINQAMHQELQKAFDAYAADPEQHVCVITGAGQRAFCAGSDLKESVATQGQRAYPRNGYGTAMRG
jgi:enoyl-CoA hydratase/carnithine racemase